MKHEFAVDSLPADTAAGVAEGTGQAVNNPVATTYGCYAGGKTAANKVTYTQTTAQRGTVGQIAFGCVAGAVGFGTAAEAVVKSQPGFTEGFKRGWNSVE